MIFLYISTILASKQRFESPPPDKITQTPDMWDSPDPQNYGRPCDLIAREAGKKTFVVSPRCESSLTKTPDTWNSSGSEDNIRSQLSAKAKPFIPKRNFFVPTNSPETEWIAQVKDSKSKQIRVTIEGLPPVARIRDCLSSIYKENIPREFRILAMPDGTMKVDLVYEEEIVAQEVQNSANGLIWFSEKAGLWSRLHFKLQGGFFFGHVFLIPPKYVQNLTRSQQFGELKTIIAKIVPFKE